MVKLGEMAPMCEGRVKLLELSKLQNFTWHMRAGEKGVDHLVVYSVSMYFPHRPLDKPPSIIVIVPS